MTYIVIGGLIVLVLVVIMILRHMEQWFDSLPKEEQDEILKALGEDNYD